MRGAPRPGSEERVALPVGERDWTGAVHAYRAHRREEQDYVQSAIAELRDALWGVVETVHRTATIEHAADTETSAQLARARVAIGRLDPGQVKQEVLEAVSRIEQVARERQQRTREHYTALSRSLDAVGRQLEEAKRESTTDALTGLGNRKLFDLVTARARSLATLNGQAVSLIMIDADGLKAINDTFGHPVGDAAIVGIGKALARTFLRQGDVLCRIGGDEFAVILANTDGETAQRLATRFVGALAEWRHPDEDVVAELSASCGVAVLGAHEPIEEWIRRADAALYQAKGDATRRTVLDAS
ncbi:MAG: GGDEF domain-containing protein [Gemmatimonadaceae bacterium]|nr:GGDEF domain-containing protein [Gemmatimonadaceae bacterium]